MHNVHMGALVLTTDKLSDLNLTIFSNAVVNGGEGGGGGAFLLTDGGILCDIHYNATPFGGGYV